MNIRQSMKITLLKMKQVTRFKQKVIVIGQIVTCALENSELSPS